MSTRVFLVDDQPAVRRGLEILLAAEPGLVVCGQSDNAADAVAQILCLKPDLVIVDLTLRQSSGLDLMRDLRAFGLKQRLLVFSMHTQASHVRAALRAGADGYVAKEEGTENLLEAIRVVMEGRSYLTAPIAARLAKAAEAPPSSFPKPPGPG